MSGNGGYKKGPVLKRPDLRPTELSHGRLKRMDLRRRWDQQGNGLSGGPSVCQVEPGEVAAYDRSSDILALLANVLPSRLDLD